MKEGRAVVGGVCCSGRGVCDGRGMQVMGGALDSSKEGGVVVGGGRGHVS